MMLEREMMMSLLVLVGAEKKKQEKKFRILKDKRKAKIQRAHSLSLLMQTSVSRLELLKHCTFLAKVFGQLLGDKL